MPRLQLKPSHDQALNRALFRQAFPVDHWVGDHHAFWVLWDGPTPAGFCSAVHLVRDNTVFLSSAGVFAPYQGRGLQRRLIQARLRWARRLGATTAVTYVRHSNPVSLVNLLRTGFQIYSPQVNWAGRDVWYLQRAP
jgi:GNAT superfamily N-acetyltransferase